MFALDECVFTVGEQQSKADIVLEMERDGSMVVLLDAAFDGIQYMAALAKAFIENWEAENANPRPVEVRRGLGGGCGHCGFTGESGCGRGALSA